MPRWTIEEEVIVLYYASRRVRNTTIVELLAKKCSPRVRNLKQIAHKSSRLRRICGQKKVESEDTLSPPFPDWDLKLVDQWLFSKMEKAKLQQLLEFDGETAAIINELNSLDEFVGIMALDDGKQADQLDQPDQPENNERHQEQNNSSKVEKH